ncbi:hypothetical protein J2802_003352 [Paraburkholderia caribensis]|nr:SymE family type I addiction module toxin [Paraburkholderia caribensis]MDR6382932.1 hypothetical protein [Paraburkholderia caribensis]
MHLRSAPPLYPWMKLGGRWIDNAGFAAGQRVKIAVEHGRLTITVEQKNKGPRQRPFLLHRVRYKQQLAMVIFCYQPRKVWRNNVILKVSTFFDYFRNHMDWNIEDKLLFVVFVHYKPYIFCRRWDQLSKTQISIVVATMQYSRLGLKTPPPSSRISNHKRLANSLQQGLSISWLPVT